MLYFFFFFFFFFNETATTEIYTLSLHDALPIALAGFLLNWFLARSRFGLRAMAIRDDEDAARAMGVRTTSTKVVAFALSAILPAIAGGLFAWNNSYLDPG